MNHTIPQEALDILKQVVITGNLVKLPPGQLARPLYEKVNKVLELAGGKWNKKERAHVFSEPPDDILGDAVTTGEILDAKKATQFYVTPPELADKMVQILEPKKSHRILEPSAGSGNLLHAVFRQLPLATITAVELDRKRATKLPEDYPGDLVVHNADFLQWAPDNVSCFHRVIMNPPFSKGQDIKHVRAAFNCLAPGGRLVAITSPGWKYRQDRLHTEFRQWVHSLDWQSIDLEPGTFESSGTMVSSVLLTIDKSK